MSDTTSGGIRCDRCGGGVGDRYYVSVDRGENWCVTCYEVYVWAEAAPSVVAAKLCHCGAPGVCLDYDGHVVCPRHVQDTAAKRCKGCGEAVYRGGPGFWVTPAGEAVHVRCPEATEYGIPSAQEAWAQIMREREASANAIRAGYPLIPDPEASDDEAWEKIRRDATIDGVIENRRNRREPTDQELMRILCGEPEPTEGREDSEQTVSLPEPAEDRSYCVRNTGPGQVTIEVPPGTEIRSGAVIASGVATRDEAQEVDCEPQPHPRAGQEALCLVCLRAYVTIDDRGEVPRCESCAIAMDGAVCGGEDVRVEIGPDNWAWRTWSTWTPPEQDRGVRPWASGFWVGIALANTCHLAALAIRWWLS